MICPFDQYGEGRHIYTFTNRCRENPDLEMQDGTMKIILNAAGTMDDVNSELREFLDYVAGKMSDNEYVQRVDKAVKQAKRNSEWRREYMTLMMRDLENKEEGRAEGRLAGKEEGLREAVENALDAGIAPEEVARILKQPIEFVKDIAADKGLLQTI